jgi:hypothetical protein
MIVASFSSFVFMWVIHAASVVNGGGVLRVPSSAFVFVVPFIVVSPTVYVSGAIDPCDSGLIVVLVVVAICVEDGFSLRTALTNST